jgi:hypothetical protein
VEIKLKNKVWFFYGKLYGFGIGFTISKDYFNINLGFWYIGLEWL